VETIGQNTPVHTLYHGSFSAAKGKALFEALSYYPENLIYAEKSGKVYIQNKTGLYIYDLNDKNVKTVGICPGLHKGDEYPIYRPETAAVSPNDRFVLSKTAVSPTKANLSIYDIQTGKSKLVSENAEIKPGKPVALWSKDSNYFIYQKNGNAYYYSMTDYRNKKQLSEEARKLGEVNLDNILWTDSNYLIWIENNLIWLSDPAQFFARSIYKNYLRQGEIIGKLPFELVPATDKFIYNELSKKFLIVKDSNAIYYYSLNDDMQENPYLKLDDNARYDKSLLFNNGNALFTTKIITDGTSAGGAMSALMGATGNNPAYEPLLQAMGAAPVRDNVFASVCYCPIIDLEHADMAYEWLFNSTDSRQNGDPDVLAVSNQLKAQFPAYLESLALQTEDDNLLTADNYLNYIKKELIRSAQIAKNAGADIPDSLGFTFSEDTGFGAPPINGVASSPAGKAPLGARGQRAMQNRMGGKKVGEYVTDLDMERYLNYVVSTQPLKTAPAFDTQGVVDQRASGENEEFGDSKGSSVNFTEYSAAKTGTVVTPEISTNVALLNPMNFIGDAATDVAPHWYIRHGARDRDTAFPIPVNLALRLQNAGKDVDFLLAWNRPHSGDYALDELFQWISSLF
jgi:hypothetical protein